jgi:two-component system aerobic respiration control sensor histidine kinase ArcB
MIDEKKYWQESQFLPTLINLLPHYVFWKDKDSVFLGCNENFARIAGLSSAAEIVGKTDYDLPWEKRQSDTYRIDDQYVIQTKIPKINIEEPQTLVNGEKIVLLTSKVPLIDQEDHVIGILVMYIDITHLKKKEQELEEAKKASEEANLLKTQFIQHMEHDIRTPFNGVLGMANILANQETDSIKKECLMNLVACARELLNYCNTILDFSKIETGKLPTFSKLFRLRPLLNSIIAMETPAAKIKNLELSLQCEQSAPDFLIGDSHRLKQILINLISNAIKFTEMGYIKISVKLAKSAENSRDVIIKIMIEDTGIGIPESKQNIIFERFTKVVDNYRTVYKGYGLGLRIVKQFVTEMEGDIHLESHLGRGSTFSLFLPFQKALVEDESLNMCEEFDKERHRMFE